MEKTKVRVSNEDIESFLQGSNPQKYIVAIEAGYDKPSVTLVINDPESGKRLEEDGFKPFLWFNDEVAKKLYGGKKMETIKACTKYGIKITKLRTANDQGESPERMENGYKYLAVCTKSYNHLVNFFKEGGLEVFTKDKVRNFVIFSPVEQYMIQSGKRMFKGMDDYDDVHRFQFDLETEGLFATRDAIFQIGVRDNKGLEGVMEVTGDGREKRESERKVIAQFFNVIDAVKPDIITGYNSENFDWPYLFERADRLGMDITSLAKTLSMAHKIKRKSASLKLGGETENYEQTHMYGYNILDISHAVRRAMAINSEIKGWGLKYITQYSEIAKPNRVYVPGDKINTTWADVNNDYAFNDTNGDWYKITEKAPLKNNYIVSTGANIVQRYLCDDLWETEQIDNIFNQASFLIAKMLPTTLQRSSTMGTAGQWKLIMSAWSYENGLAIPKTQPKRDFVGGLSRLLEVGYARNVLKLDYAALYPKAQLTHGIFPLLDISGMMEGTLTYIVDTRDKFKFLAGKEKKKLEKLKDELKAGKDLTKEEVTALEKEIHDVNALFNMYDKKQLPLKILANSWFGSYGAPYIFNWGDTDSAEETTCRGRQYLRLMVRYFKKHGFKPLVGDTDGFNFAIPEGIEKFKYTATGAHWKTTEYKDVELTGLNAILAKFNEKYMIGRMGLDIDDLCDSTINFARKNYANDINGKIKLVGNSIKSKKMSVYIEDFLGKSIRMLLDGDGYSFIKYYQEYVDKIYNYQIPLVKIASKSRVKLSITDYKKKAKMLNKAGKPLPKQAHMELAMRAGIETTLGDTLYYINTGTSKSQGDLKTVDLNAMTKKQQKAFILENPDLPFPPPKKEVQLHCKLINNETVEQDFELIKELEMLKKAILTLDKEEDAISILDMEVRIDEIDEQLYTDEYNVAKYLFNFNKKVKPLLVCFNEEIRNEILLDVVKIKDKDTKITTDRLQERRIFTKGECELVSGIPFKVTDQDTYEDLMTMEDKEIKFWDKVDKLPNNMEQEEWDEIRADYLQRMIIAKEEGVQFEKDSLDDILKHLEVKDYKQAMEGVLPLDIFILCDIADDDSWGLISRKWGEVLCYFDDIFKYEHEAKSRDAYYKKTGNQDYDNRYQDWENYVSESMVMNGVSDVEVTNNLLNVSSNAEVLEKIKESAANIVKEEPIIIKKVKVLKENDDEDDELEEDEDGNLIRNDEEIQLDDEFDDTYGDVPDGYVAFEEITDEIIKSMTEPKIVAKPKIVLDNDNYWSEIEGFYGE